MENLECFRLEVSDHVGHLIFSRPEKRNTMSLGFFPELKTVFEHIDDQDEIRSVLISAEGKSFTAGLDLMEASSLFQEISAKNRHNFRKLIMQMQDAFSMVERCRKPVVAAIHSHCIGGGVDLTAACDIRIAARNTIFSIRETRMAMVADLGTLQRITAIVGQGWARELALTGRDFSAWEARKMGFVTHVYPCPKRVREEGLKLARQIAQLSPLTVQGVKETLNFSRDHGVAAGLEYVAQKNSAILPNEDLMEAFQAFMEKRPPKYKGC